MGKIPTSVHGPNPVCKKLQDDDIYPCDSVPISAFRVISISIHYGGAPEPISWFFLFEDPVDYVALFHMLYLTCISHFEISIKLN